nr:ABC transporter ATP-binding protein [Streptomyces chartreusis]
MLISLLRLHARRYRKGIFCLALLDFVATSALLYLPALNAKIIDSGVVEGDVPVILYIGSAMIVVAVGTAAVYSGAVYFGSRIAMAIGRDLRNVIFDHILTLSPIEATRFGTPSLITRTINDVNQLQLLILTVLQLFIATPLLCIGGVLMASVQDLPLAGTLLASIPILWGVVAILLRRLRPLLRSTQSHIDTITKILREQFAGLRVVRAFVQEEHERRRFDASNREYTGLTIRVGRLMSLMSPCVMLIVNLSGLTVLWLGAHRIDSGDMQIGALIASFFYLMQVMVSVMMAASVAIVLPRAYVCAERIQEILLTDSSVVAPSASAGLPPIQGILQLQEVGFCYPGAEVPVLRGVDLTIRPGEATAIVGPTGSGKSTLLALVLRLFNVTTGEIFLDGVNIRKIAAEDLVKAVSFVPQKPQLFAGTVATNLRYGSASATDDELWHVLTIAQARDFVEALPGGLHARISPGGSNLSGGQKQRLAIARALLSKAKVYLFDDPFSALDSDTADRLRRALFLETSSAAVVIVSQRISMIRNLDRIILLEEGVVSGVGTHVELVERAPSYRDLVLSQSMQGES